MKILQAVRQLLRLFERNFEIRGDAVAADESFRARDFWHSKEALSD